MDPELTLLYPWHVLSQETNLLSLPFTMPLYLPYLYKWMMDLAYGMPEVVGLLSKTPVSTLLVIICLFVIVFNSVKLTFACVNERKQKYF
jgi:hypothetical protein